MTNDQLEAVRLVMENVNRLIDDATLLVQHGRLPSAFVLNVIALEEVGKVVHMRWDHLGRTTTRQQRTAHLQKQWAVASLLTGAKLWPHYKAMFTDKPERQAIHLMQLAEAFMDSDERRFFENVIAKNIDRAKQLGLYEDEDALSEGKNRDDIDAETVKAVSDTLLQAVPLLADDAALLVGSVFYELLPALQDAILAAPDRLIP